MKFLAFSQTKLGSSFDITRARVGGASVIPLLSSLLFSVPPSRRKVLGAKPKQAGKKEGGWGEGIFARLFCAVGAVGWEAFPPFGIKPNIKAKQFSNPFKRKMVARKIKELKRKLFCFARRVSAGGNAGAGFQIIRAIVAQKRFELRSAIATNQDILKIEGHLVARSPRLRRVSLCKKPCISELNRKGGQIQIQFFGKANGSSAGEARNPANGIPNFFRFLQKAKIQSKFLIPCFCAVGAMAKGDIIN